MVASFDFNGVTPEETAEKCLTNLSYSESDFGTMFLCYGKKE